MTVTNDRDTTALEFYRDIINEALRTHADIVVQAPEGGETYMREVKGQSCPRTLVIGPIPQDDVDEIAAYIRSWMKQSGIAVNNSMLNAAQFSLRCKPTH